MPAAPGRRLVALAEPPGQRFLDVLGAAWDAGDAVLPLDPRAPADVTRRLLAAMHPDRPVADGVALVIATSGSTGEPKGVELTHDAITASIRAAHERIGREADDVWLSCLPWHHIGGLQVALRSRLLGIPLVVHETFDAARVADAAATLMSIVPTQLVRLLDAGVDLARFRVILLGGAAAPAALLDRARDAGAPIVTTYGMSETAGGCVYDGRPLDGVDVTTTDDGRVRLRGPMLMAGYRGRPDLTAQALVDGWLVTADLGVVEAGRLRVTGRVDDVIITGGENVLATAVAAHLTRHPAIAEAEVAGVPDPVWGQRVVAVVVVRDTTAELSLDALREWCVARLPVAARPRGLAVVERIPRLPSGKTDRGAVTRIAAAAGSGDAGA